MIEKFTTSNNKLGDILAARKRNQGRGGLSFVDKGKTIIGSVTIFIKATSSKKVGENFKLVLVKSSKKNIHSHKIG
ncbi:hypothetical protein J1N35_023135 [Gossypium stocksii]|uniref:Uncharacterized protein n=1 Tax=Gossypium stocksii TaxID=47602 RepID=A0A9D3VJN9_9ROSI|nr:hypothetical protein J1N35_023135 [Gossypium stocksii]